MRARCMMGGTVAHLATECNVHLFVATAILPPRGSNAQGEDIKGRLQYPEDDPGLAAPNAR